VTTLLKPIADACSYVTETMKQEHVTSSHQVNSFLKLHDCFCICFCSLFYVFVFITNSLRKRCVLDYAGFCRISASHIIISCTIIRWNY